MPTTTRLSSRTSTSPGRSEELPVRRLTLMGVALLAALANVVPAFAATWNHNETFLKDRE